MAVGMYCLSTVLECKRAQAELTRKTQQLNKFKIALTGLSSAVSDGIITADEFAKLDSSVSGIASGFAMASVEYANGYVDYNRAQIEDMMASGELSDSAFSGYIDEIGNLNEEALEMELYQEGLLAYLNNVFLQEMSEMEAKLENDQAQIELEQEQLKGMEDFAQQAVSNAAQDAPKFFASA